MDELLGVALELNEKNSQWVLIALCMLVGVYLVLRPKRKKKDPLDEKPFRVSLSQQRSSERQMENLLVELSEMTRQMTAQLDTRAAKLEALIADADHRIATLKKISASQSMDESPAVPLSTVALSSGTLSTVYRDIDTAPEHEPIYRLAEQGQTVADIASKLNRPSGEVELILALRGRK